jgi:hypothetical protein
MPLKADGGISGVVKGTKDPKGPAGPDLSIKRVMNTQIYNQSNPHDDLTTSEYPDTRIAMACAIPTHYSRAALRQFKTHCVDKVVFFVYRNYVLISCIAPPININCIVPHDTTLPAHPLHSNDR